MREIEVSRLTDVIEKLCIEANEHLPEDVKCAIKTCCACEDGEIAKGVLDNIIENFEIADNENVPICQDTGMACVFLEIGQDVHFVGGNLEDAINEGVRRGYDKGYLRKSVVKDPVRRGNTGDNTPAMIYTEIVPGDQVKITVGPKGFGSENMSQIRMFKPSAGLQGIKDFILEVVETAGPNPCPPMVVGVGIGGTFDKCALLAKKALMRPLNTENPDPYYADLEKEMLEKINKLGIGPGGLGGTTTALAVTVALSVGNLINPGIGLDMSAIKTSASTVETMEATSLTDTILNIIPDNPINSLASGTMLQVIVFALIIGVILAKMGERAETVANFFSQFNDIMMEMTMMIMSLAPIGVFCLISRTFATIGFSAFVPLAKYMIAVLLALAIQCLGVYQILLKIFTGLNPIRFIKKFFPVMAFAFSTATSNATIPLSIETLSKKVGVSKKISSFTIPLGATINMDGTSIMQGVAVMFAAQAFGIQLTPMDYVTVIGTATLASIGTAGIPSVGLVTLTMVFNSVGLPVEAIGITMGIDRILDMARTAVNITGDAVCTTIVACQNGAVDKEVFNKAE